MQLSHWLLVPGESIHLILQVNRNYQNAPSNQPRTRKIADQFILPNFVSPVIAIVKWQNDKIVVEIADGKLKLKKQRFTYEKIVRDQLDQLDGNQELTGETIA